MTLRLRLRGPSGKQHTANLPATATLGDLCKEASSAFTLAESSMEVLLGFPPAVCESARDALLSGLVKSGDSVTVRQATSGPATQASSSEAFDQKIEAPIAVTAPTTVAKPTQTPTPAPSVGSIRTSEAWACPACTLENPGSVLKCGACDGPKPGSSSAVSGSSGAQVAKMPDDNSCLFHGIVFLLDPSKRPESLRETIANEVQANPSQWDEATLGKPRAEYISFIKDPRRWGGQVELAIFSRAYQAEVAVVQVQNGRCDVYGEGSGYQRRVYLMHSGIHFDAITFGPSAQREVLRDGFAQADAAAQQLATEQRASGGYVDQDTMRLRCKICGHIANGDYEARLHAGTVGHKEFAPA